MPNSKILKFWDLNRGVVEINLDSYPPSWAIKNPGPLQVPFKHPKDKPSNVWAVFQRDNFRCWICKDQAIAMADYSQNIKSNGFARTAITERDFLTVDHIVPQCYGGNNNVENLRPACSVCNTKRGERINKVVLDQMTPRQKLAFLNFWLGRFDYFLNNNGAADRKHPDRASKIRRLRDKLLNEISQSDVFSYLLNNEDYDVPKFEECFL